MKGVAFLLVAAVAYATHDYLVKPEHAHVSFVGRRELKTPFRTRLLNRLQNGESIRVAGTIKEDAHRFDLYFHRGTNKNCDSRLHFSFTFGEDNKFSYSTIKHEKSTNHAAIENPFKEGQQFDLRIRIINSTYQVFANRVQVAQFDIHESLDGVDHVLLEGDLSIVSQFHYGGYVFAGDYKVNLQNSGKTARFFVTGVAIGDRFNMSLNRPNGGYSLTLFINIDENTFLLKEMRKHAWIKDQRNGTLGVKKGEIIDVKIYTVYHAYGIHINDRLVAFFPYKESDKVETFEVKGSGIELHGVVVEIAAPDTFENPFLTYD